MLTDIQPRSASYTGLEDGSPVEVTITQQGVDSGDRVSVEFGGMFQANCPGSSPACSISGTSIVLDAQPVPSIQNCSLPSGAVKITDLNTGETASGPTFTYTAEVPSIQTISPASGSAAGGVATLTGTFSTSEPLIVEVDGARTTVSSTSSTSLDIVIPAYSGDFGTTTCTTSDGQSGTMATAVQVDVEVIYTDTGCEFTDQNAYSYEPPDTSCQPSSPPIASFGFSAGGDDDLTLTFTDQSSGSPDFVVVDLR